MTVIALYPLKVLFNHKNVKRLTLLGSLAVCIKHLLTHYITVVKLFSLQRLNKRIFEFSFGSVECKNRPSEIASHHLSSSGELKQSGQNLYCKLLLEVSLLKM